MRKLHSTHRVNFRLCAKGFGPKLAKQEQGCELNVYQRSAPVAKYVSPLILRHAGHAPVLHLPVRAVNKAEAIARARRRFRLRAAESKKDGARAVRGIARLEARQQHCIVRRGVAHRGVAQRHARRLWHQRRLRRRDTKRALLLFLLLWWLLRGKLAAAGERDGAEPVAVSLLAVRARLQWRVGITAAGDGEEADSEVSKVAEKGRSDVIR